MSNITIHCADETLHHQLAIQLLFHGKEDCSAGHFWGPGLRDCYILHVIRSGRGIFHGEEQSYTLTRGQGFLITPHRLVHYEADATDPWSYCWIGFQGLQVKAMLQAAGISEKQPTFSISDETFFDQLHQALLDAAKLKSYDLMLQSLIYRVFSDIVESEHRKLDLSSSSPTAAASSSFYVQQAKEWIAHNYSQKMTTGQIARHIGLNSSYLSRLFKVEYGLSLKEYMMQYRINRAIKLLNNEQLTISDVSRSVGYTDPFVFSKMFKKLTGKAPSELREPKHATKQQVQHTPITIVDSLD